MPEKHTVNVISLCGGFLDFLVARAIGLKPIYLEDTDACWITVNSMIGGGKITQYSPTQYWKHAGPIIEQEEIDVSKAVTYNDDCHYTASYPSSLPSYINSSIAIGESRLEAAMRCFIKKKLGCSLDLSNDEYRYHCSSKDWKNKSKPLPNTMLYELQEENEDEEQPINKSADSVVEEIQLVD